ncbi:MAG: glutathione S-transferase family protein [Alphaproteobacteria bacterium]|nr:MAG: glutathione S-transferase family protein [Alphaproteobacteria bacterium]
MRILYHQALCPFSRKIRFMLAEKKLDFTLKLEPFWEKREELFELNHAMEIPVFVDLSGQVVSDSHAITEYINEVYENPNLIGTSPKERAEVRRLMYWFDLKFAREVSMPFLEEKHFNYCKKINTVNSARLRKASQALLMHLDYIGWLCERRNFLAGDHFSMADIAAAAHISALDYLGLIPFDHNYDMKTWYMRIKSRPTFKEFLKDKVPQVKPFERYALLDF